MASLRSPGFFLLGDSSKALQRFEQTLRDYFLKEKLEVKGDLPSYLRSEFWKLYDVSANKCFLVLPHSPRQIIFDESHPSRSFHAEVDRIEKGKGEVFVVVYGQDDLKDTTKLYGHGVEILFKSGVQAKLREYSEGRLIELYHGKRSQLNKRQQKQIKAFCLLQLPGERQVEKESKEKKLEDIDGNRGILMQVLAYVTSQVESLVHGDGKETLSKDELENLDIQLVDVKKKVDNARKPIKSKLQELQSQDQPGGSEGQSSFATDHFGKRSSGDHQAKEGEHLATVSYGEGVEEHTPTSDDDFVHVPGPYEQPQSAEPSEDDNQQESDDLDTEARKSDRGDAKEPTDPQPRKKARCHGQIQSDETTPEAGKTLKRTGNGGGIALRPDQEQKSASETLERKIGESKRPGPHDQPQQMQRDGGQNDGQTRDPRDTFPGKPGGHPTNPEDKR